MKTLKQFVSESTSGSRIHVHSDYEDGHGPVKIHIHHGTTEHSFEDEHSYTEDHGGAGASAGEHKEYRKHLQTKHGLTPHHAKAVADHFSKIHKWAPVDDSDKDGYVVKTTHKA